MTKASSFPTAAGSTSSALGGLCEASQKTRWWETTSMAARLTAVKSMTKKGVRSSACTEDLNGSVNELGGNRHLYASLSVYRSHVKLLGYRASRDQSTRQSTHTVHSLPSASTSHVGARTPITVPAVTVPALSLPPASSTNTTCHPGSVPTASGGVSPLVSSIVMRMMKSWVAFVARAAWPVSRMCCCICAAIPPAMNF